MKVVPRRTEAVHDDELRKQDRIAGVLLKSRSGGVDVARAVPGAAWARGYFGRVRDRRRDTPAWGPNHHFRCRWLFRLLLQEARRHPSFREQSDHRHGVFSW